MERNFFRSLSEQDSISHWVQLKPHVSNERGEGGKDTRNLENKKFNQIIVCHISS